MDHWQYSHMVLSTSISSEYGKEGNVLQSTDSTQRARSSMLSLNTLEIYILLWYAKFTVTELLVPCHYCTQWFFEIDREGGCFLLWYPSAVIYKPCHYQSWWKWGNYLFFIFSYLEAFYYDVMIFWLAHDYQ